MLVSLKAFIVLVILAVAARAAEIVDFGRLADAIAEVETGGNDRAIGAAGERGRYQISFVVWQQHRGAAVFTLAHDPIEARGVVVAHLSWLAAHIRQASPRQLALAWNAGLAAANSGRTSHRQRDYAQRAANLYFDRWPTR